MVDLIDTRRRGIGAAQAAILSNEDKLRETAIEPTIQSPIIQSPSSDLGEDGGSWGLTHSRSLYEYNIIHINIQHLPFSL